MNASSVCKAHTDGDNLHARVQIRHLRQTTEVIRQFAIRKHLIDLLVQSLAALLVSHHAVQEVGCCPRNGVRTTYHSCESVCNRVSIAFVALMIVAFA